eukprot:TRINITY_DN10054_c0_g1_i2.p1 TRINITY_DN10054_c0_g1~~TRINITY_DN10054_c0_g1_i2.p1  ORF type:complete len:455 (-),score=78.00 TRINITY_DN10054_c0_g1_i2:65-1321(-)
MPTQAMRRRSLEQNDRTSLSRPTSSAPEEAQTRRRRPSIGEEEAQTRPRRPSTGQDTSGAATLAATQMRKRRVSLERRQPPIELRTLPTWGGHLKDVSRNPEAGFGSRQSTGDADVQARVQSRLVEELQEFPYIGPRRAVRTELNNALLIVRGDITRLKVGTLAYTLELSKARQNAGALGTLHGIAGGALARELETKMCEPGEVTVTEGYNLHVDTVVHASVPRRPHDKLLRSCYCATFELVERLRIRSVAFTNLGVGPGLPYSPVQAAHVALSVAREWLEKRGRDLPPQDRVIFCFAEDEEFEFFNQMAHHYFPLTEVLGEEEVDEEQLVARKVGNEVCTRYRAKGSRARDRIRQIFREWDKDGNGTISRRELFEVFRKLCPKLTTQNVEQIFAVLDKDGNGEVDVEEFVQWLDLTS